MSARRSVVVTINRDADGGEPPNRYRPFVTAHVRLHWPPLAADWILR